MQVTPAGEMMMGGVIVTSKADMGAAMSNMTGMDVWSNGYN